MRDTHRRYRAIAQCLLHLYPHVHGHQRRHLATLARLITGIVGSQHTQLPNVVEQTPGGHAADECGVMRFRRRLKHNDVTSTGWMPPAVKAFGDKAHLLITMSPPRDGCRWRSTRAWPCWPVSRRSS